QRQIRDNALHFQTSRKCSVQEPGRRPSSLREIAIESGPEQPETQPALVLNPEIIPCGPAVLAPPGALDAFRTFGGNYLVQRTSPSESQRWAVRHFRHRLDWLRSRQQPQWTRRKLYFSAVATERSPANITVNGLRGENSLCQLRNMAILRSQPVHASRAQPCTQAV